MSRRSAIQRIVDRAWRTMECSAPVRFAAARSDTESLSRLDLPLLPTEPSRLIPCCAPTTCPRRRRRRQRRQRRRRGRTCPLRRPWGPLSPRRRRLPSMRHHRCARAPWSLGPPPSQPRRGLWIRHRRRRRSSVRRQASRASTRTLIRVSLRRCAEPSPEQAGSLGSPLRFSAAAGA
jgi:hypothetical protein